MAVLATLAFATSASWAGNPHFVTCTETISGNTITVDGKEAGLGSETQVHIELNATAQCVNPGSNKPKAANKQSLNSAGDFPVQNGQAVFQLSVTASFQPDCSPPMSVIFTDVSACDTEHGVCCSF
jgi:hypothetical protein